MFKNNCLLLLLMVLLPAGQALAQEPSSDLVTVLQGPETGGGEPIPIDGGVGLLITAGMGYGIKVLRDNRKASR